MNEITVTITQDDLCKVTRLYEEEPMEHATARYVRDRLRGAGMPIILPFGGTVIELIDPSKGTLYWHHDDYTKTATITYTPRVMV